MTGDVHIDAQTRQASECIEIYSHGLVGDVPAELLSVPRPSVQRNSGLLFSGSVVYVPEDDDDIVYE